MHPKYSCSNIHSWKIDSMSRCALFAEVFQTALHAQCDEALWLPLKSFPTIFKEPRSHSPAVKCQQNVPTCLTGL